MITQFFSLLILIITSKGQDNIQSGGIPEENTGCQTGFDCVNKHICVDGVIDVEGGGLITTRIKQSTCTGDNICCRIPGYVEPLEPNQCRFNEDCVTADICTPEGIIDVEGSSLITRRNKFKPLRTCFSHELPNIHTACCLRPYKCPEHKECVDNYHCGVDGLIDRTGSLQSYLQNGIKCISEDGKINGICCSSKVEIREAFPISGVCGIRNDKNLDKHVDAGYGKQDALFGEFPWQAIIFLASDKAELLFKCAGTLVSDRHVITAAHCVNLLQPKDIGVRLGEYEVSGEKEAKPYVDRDVKSILIHPQYRSTSLKFNLAIIEMNQAVEFDYHINSICLAENRQQFSSKCVATGWGKESFQGNYQAVLKRLDLPYVDHGYCQTLLRRTVLSKYFQLHQSVACAGGEEGKDTCTGDGGGPLACLEESTGKYYLAGVVVAGLKCGAKDVPGLYANVPYMNDWIGSVIGY